MKVYIGKSYIICLNLFKGLLKKYCLIFPVRFIKIKKSELIILFKHHGSLKPGQYVFGIKFCKQNRSLDGLSCINFQFWSWLHSLAFTEQCRKKKA